jgi:hypothetical protein
MQRTMHSYEKKHAALNNMQANKHLDYQYTAEFHASLAAENAKAKA